MKTKPTVSRFVLSLALVKIIFNFNPGFSFSLKGCLRCRRADPQQRPASQVPQLPEHVAADQQLHPTRAAGGERDGQSHLDRTPGTRDRLVVDLVAVEWNHAR